MRLSRAAVLVVVLALAGTARAQDAGQQALARAQALLRQVSAQKQELEAANARLTAEVNTLQKNLTRAQSSLKQTTLDLQSELRKSERNGKDLDSTRQRLERTEATLRETIEKLRAASTDLQRLRSDQADLEAKLAATDAELADSERKNLALYQANVEILEKYRRKGPLDALLQREPVTGLKQVAIESELLEYQARLEESLREKNRAEPPLPADAHAGRESASP